MNNELVLKTPDALSIHARVFHPESEVKAGVIINAATAVKQSYYQRFAQFLAQNGYLVVTYDYRGIGQSAIQDTRDLRLTMQAWGEKDLATVIDWVTTHHSALDWHCIGHSVGGQILGLAANNTVFKSVYCVSSQSGYWANWEGISKPRMFAMWYFAVPVLSTLFGKVPGVFLGGEALPGCIAKQWAYWGRDPHYIIDENGTPIRDNFEQMTCDIKFKLIDDDMDFAPPKSVHQLASFYSNANVEIETVKTKQLGTKVGHFGFFRKKHEDDLWLDALAWLNKQYPSEIESVA
ncbi:alpha/beta fold hydrolase [Vibrio sp. SCSIO 43153]|uniref:alpha/beta hydrolase family protein n=1 Tax=Vibrio sp. SCSIO 43153 TaxID=2819098 RepID=UPI002074B365|nr:alpha/beta fold hydrolase [Vibrio sp. SCSIO 43153]USD52632.1 alpha/beta fold hydrolase [Vibrio sp. SCSIO 43153]